MRLLPLFLLAAIFAPSQPALADPLAEVERSRQMRRLELERQSAREGPLAAARREAILPSDTNLAVVFREHGDEWGSTVLSWMRPFDPRVKLRLESAIRLPEYADIKFNFTPPDAPAAIEGRLLVPHPRYAEMVSLGVVNEFSTLEGTPFTRQELRDQPIGQWSGKLVRLKSGECWLVTELTIEARLKLTWADGGAACETLPEAAKLINLDRLAAKLAS